MPLLKGCSRTTKQTSAAGYALLFAVLTAIAAQVEAAQPGIVGITHGSVDAVSPPAGSNWYYGIGMPMQLDATTGGLLVNIRRNGTPYSDFEAGTDLIKFNSLNDIRAAKAVPVSRSGNELNPWTGTAAITSKYPVLGGFVPLGGRFADGSAHPHDGTGFGMCEVGFYPADYSQPLSGRIGYLLEFQQFSYDGNQFTASAPARMSADGLPVGNTGWNITAPGLSPAIPDGEDLLFAATCSNASSSGIAGVARFQYGVKGWQPTSFVPVTSPAEAWFEPSLIRDVDGSLLFSGRHDSNGALALWRSIGGNTWNQSINVPYARAYAPVVLSQAVDGSPFFTTTTAASIDRNILDLVPINADRTGVDSTLTVRNAPAEFGSAPNGQGWHVDHGIGNVIRLADGQWHSLLTYRVDDRGEHFGLPASAYTGYYVEEVFSSGDPRLMGLTFVPEPASGLMVLFAAAGILGSLAIRRSFAFGVRRVIATFLLVCAGLTSILTEPVLAAQPFIIGVTHGKVDAAIPPTTPKGQDWRYGLGLPIQLDATTGGLLVNIRQNGTQYCDFEVGTDLIPFTSLDKIDAANAVAVSRPSKEKNPWTGTPSITSKYPMMGGFVPRGAKRADGSPHPHHGTGFGICEVGFYPADFTQPLSGRIGYHVELQQLAYDGRQFTASPPVRMERLSVGTSGWNITGVGLSPAIPDGDDLLFPVTCSNSSSVGISGVARFQHGKDGWQPSSFVPITNVGATWFEPSLIRDVDGSLLFTARNDAGSPISVWRLTDGKAWKRLIHIDNARAYAPVVLNQALDGAPFLVTTLATANLAASNDRNILEIVPIDSARTSIGKPILVRNGPTEFGVGPVASEPHKKGWFIDHCTGNVIRLADGRWHSIISYRVDAKVEHYGEPGTPHTGHYVEEVSSSGKPQLMGFTF